MARVFIDAAIMVFLLERLMSQVEGYVLRIATKQWVSQVFSLAIYFTKLRRKWKKGQMILFMHRTSIGDAFVGYGVVEALREIDELSQDDKATCEQGGWKRAIEFTYVKQFEKPLAVRNTFLRDSKLRGRCFHGLKLSNDQMRSIMVQAEA